LKSEILNFSIVWPALCAGLTVLVLWLSLLPADSVPPVGLDWDKLNHAAAIAAVSLAAFLALKKYRWAVTAAFLYGISLGGAIELLQAIFTTTRSAEWSDLLADLIGGGSICFLISVVRRKRERS